MKTKTLLHALALAGLTSLGVQAATVETPGFLKFESWFTPLRDPTLVGIDVGTLTLDPNYPNTPDMTSYTVGCNTRAVFPDDGHEQYGARLSGWITPAVSGDYHLYLASDDDSELWISADASEANLSLVAADANWADGFLEPGIGNATTWAPISMVAGQKYAIRILLKEGVGGDWVRMAMQSTTGTIPAASLTPLVGTMVSAAADPAGASLSITQQPTDTSMPENTASVAFSVTAAATTPFGKYTRSTTSWPTNGLADALGTKAQLDVFYQWFTNGVEVSGANAATYAIAWPKKALSGLKVKCYVAVPGIPIYSSEATLTITDDVIKPTVVKAKADVSFTTVVVSFSEPVTDSALVPSKYQVDQGVVVSAADRVDAMTVKLTTSKMEENRLYTLTVNDVQDTAVPANTIDANSTVQFQSFVYVAGVGLRQRYDGFNNDSGYNVNNLFNSPKFPNNPDRRSLTKRFEFPDDAAGNVEMPDWPSTAGREFFDTTEVWFTPPTTGNYVFFTAFADHSYVFLSTDENPANKVQIIAVDGWTDPRMWLTGHDLDMTRTRSDTSTANQWATAPTITLTAGKKYHMMMVHHQPTWGGGQYYACTYKLEGQPDPADGSTPKLEKEAIGVYLDPAMGGSVAFNTQPINITAYAGTQVTFYSAASGSSPYSTNVIYQWQTAPQGSSVFTNIPGATSANYTTDYLVAGQNGRQFRVTAMVPPAIAVSSVATLTVLVDETAPTVVRASTDMSWTTVDIKYSEPVTDATALNRSLYSFDQGVTISTIVRVDPLTVRLTTSQLVEGRTYILTLNGIRDAAGNTIAANTIVEVRTLTYVAGAALHKKYDNFANSSPPSALFADPRFPNKPDRVDLMQMWEYPANGLGRDWTADPTRNYMDTLEGYFIPPQDGDYVFIAAGPDTYWLYLSTDEDPANKKMIAALTGGWNAPRNWVTGAGTPPTDIVNSRSDTYANTEWPGGATIHLTGGQRYYMLEVHMDPSWCGQDWFGATYKLASDPDPANGSAPRMAGSAIGYYFDPSGATVNFTQQPQSTTGVQGQVATFTVVATGSSVYGTTVFYQWQSAPSGSSMWTDIPGATAATYTTPMLTLADNGTQFRVIASVPPYSLQSSIATLTVQPDTAAPVVTAGAMQSDVAGVVDVGIGFNETVDDAAGVLANYTVSPGTITSITVYTNRFTANSQNPFAKILKQSVLLKVTGLTGTGSVTVRNVGDVYGNKITSVDVPITVDTNMRWGVVGGHEFAAGWNAVTPVAPNGWDVYSDGVGAWGTYDEATFVYEQITGDFDKKLRVAYQDGSTTWARAGLIAKEATAFGLDRNMQSTNGLAPRYQKCLVYPVGATLSGPGTLGTATWSLNRRQVTGGVTDGGAFSGPNSTPLYPNAWCRMKREGQTFSMYRSDDGINWTLLGTTTWPATNQMPATLFVGPDYAPEIGSVTQVEDRGTFLAQFRDYGNYSAVFNPDLRIGRDSTGTVTITWTSGTLVSSPTVDGTYTPVTGATSPYSPTPSATTFYKVQQ